MIEARWSFENVEHSSIHGPARRTGSSWDGDWFVSSKRKDFGGRADRPGPFDIFLYSNQDVPSQATCHRVGRV